MTYNYRCFHERKLTKLHFFPLQELLNGLFTFFAAIPGKPSGVTLVEAVKDCMVLSWTEPAKNGGADIRGYFVDYRTVKGDVTGKWHEMNHQAVTTTSYKVSYKVFLYVPSWI